MKGKETSRLEFKNSQNEDCEVIRMGNDYHYYVNGYHRKSIRAIRPYFIVMAIRAFTDELIYEAGINYNFIEI
jgi:hypothetical protein